MAKLSWFKEKASALLSTTPAVELSPVLTDEEMRSASVPIGEHRCAELLAEAGPLTPPRQPIEAANRWLTWMQEQGFVGDVGWNALPGDPRRAGVLDCYYLHCAEERTTPLRPKTFATALGKSKAIERRQILSGGRKLTVYWIPDSIERYWINNEGHRNAEDQRSH